MKKLKKIIAVLTAAVISVTALVTTTFTASAKGVFDDATTMKSMTYYSHKFGKEETIYYKIKLNSSGTLKLYCEKATQGFMYGTWPKYTLIDNNMNEYGNGGLFNNTKDEIKDLSKGTYYLKIYSDGQSFTNLYYNFESDGKTTVVEEPTATIALKLEKGDSFRVAVVAADYDGKIKWTTTKKSVATISKGKVVAKGEGKARIRAYLDDGSYTEIMVIVEE